MAESQINIGVLGSPVDINRINKGDEVTVRAVVTGHGDRRIYLEAETQDALPWRFSVLPEAIVSHTPARPLGLDDPVRLKSAPEVRGKVRAISEGHAWIKLNGPRSGFVSATLTSVELDHE